MPNSGFCLKVVLKIKELQGCNSDFSFREEGGNRVGGGDLKPVFVCFLAHNS